MDRSKGKCSINEVFEQFDHLQPDAYAELKGGPLAPNLTGFVLFYQLTDGVLIRAYITGIPLVTSSGNPSAFHGFHIHEMSCTGMSDSMAPFAAAGGHYNPTNQPHPLHAGDLPPIMSTNGIAMMSVYANQFNIRDIIGRSIVLHEDPDDFMTQPSGNSGARLACGNIYAYAVPLLDEYSK